MKKLLENRNLIWVALAWIECAGFCFFWWNDGKPLDAFFAGTGLIGGVMMCLIDIAEKRDAALAGLNAMGWHIYKGKRYLLTYDGEIGEEPLSQNTNLAAIPVCTEGK